MQRTIDHTNARLENWYANVKLEYGVNGSGVATFNKETEEIEIRYEEDGIKCLFSHPYHPDYKISTIFDIWQTEANPDNDRI